MAFDENLAARIRRALARMWNIDEKKMFGSVVAKVGKGWRLIEVWDVSP